MTVIELLEEQFGEMLYDEDCYGLDPAEIYNVILFKDTKRAKEILDELGVEYDDYKQIQLQGIGRRNAIPVDNLEIGMHIIYNYGATSEIVDIVPCGTKYRSVYTKNQDGYVGKPRRYLRDRLIAVQEIQ